MKIIKAPNSLFDTEGSVIFLAGSIEMGTAEKWHEKVTDAFKDANVTFLNPRRDDWDSTWTQSINNRNFREQVDWELDGLESANIVVFYFDPSTKSPISLLELGLLAKTVKPVYVCCPDGFWRKGNVEIVCANYGMQLFSSLSDLTTALRHDMMLS